jgi:hypothetical protein
MLDTELIAPADPARAAAVFHRDGFVAIKDALTPAQLDFARAGARRVVDEQMAATPLEDANRGHARYSFGSQIHHSEWTQLIELPTVLPVLDAIWGSEHYICSGGGGDYSSPGARIQHLHSDMADMLADPLGQVSIYDMPVPFIVVNFLMVDFAEINGAIRFVPGTQRTRLRPPKLDHEPEHWRRSIVCAPAGTALVRDVRCWHGGTANDSDELRIMTSIGYYAPWFRRPGMGAPLPMARFEELSTRGKEMCRNIADWEGEETSSPRT